jgi:hypothetical protein
MAKFLIQIEDQDDEITVQCAIDPPLTEDRAVFSTAELVGLYLREHMADLLKAAVQWSKEPEVEQEPVVQAPKLILPGGMNGTPK